MKVSEESLTTHTLYIKEHNVRDTDSNKPSDRTLFVLNVAPFLNETQLKEIFSVAGKVELLNLSNKPSSSEKNIEETNLFKSKDIDGFKVAHVVYSKESGLRKALKLQQLNPPQTCLKTNNGLAKWIGDYNNSIPKVKLMKEEIKSFMEKYDLKIKEQIEKEKTMGEADDEGWVTVTRQGRNPGFERKESTTNKILSQKEESQKKKQLKNFYTFQIRESKMNHIIALRKKFEEDKKKIAMLKQSRKFKPF